MKAPFPPDEARRLVDLRAYHILDTAPEQQFDDLTLIASQICGTEIALITLIDSDRQWFKSRRGVDATETPRDLAFCGYSILSDDLLVVEDATKDPRFSDHPMVVGEPRIRFYAGAPLCTPTGSRIGTLCVVDKKPSKLSEAQRTALRALARQVIGQLELRAAHARMIEHTTDLERAARESVDTADRLFAIQSALQRSLELQRAIFESTDYAIISTTPDGIITAFNPAAERMLGWSAGEMIGLATPERFHVESEVISRATELSIQHGRPIAPGFSVFVQDALDKQGGERIWTYLRKDGFAFPVNLSVTALRGLDGQVTGFLGVARDLSAEIAADKQRRNSEAKFRTMADHAPLGTFLTDPEGDALYCNAAWYTISGLTEKEALGKGWASAIHPDDRKRVFTEWYRAAKAGQEFECEFRFQRPDGTVVWTHSRAAALYNDGTLLGHVGTVEDVSERRHAAEALQESEKRYRSVISALSEGIVLQNQLGGIEAWNESATKILGLTGDQLAGRDSMDPRWRAVRENGSAFPGGDHPAMVTLRTGAPCDDQIMGLLWPTGERRWVSINTRPLFRDGESKPYSVVTSFHDITARLQATQALEKAKLAAETANRAKSAFLANMSHEIRTPMTAILGYADLLDDPQVTAAERTDYVQVIRRNGGHLTRIIDDVLDLSKIEAGGMTVERIAFRPAHVIEEVASLMRVQAIDKGIRFHVDYDPSLPRIIRSDPQRIRQIVLNLVSNAIKFTERGGVRVFVSSFGENARQKLRIEVSDTGIGMTPVQQVGLFRAFAQADVSMSRRFGGSGLGLAICKHLTEMLGGGLEVASVIGKGSTFTATLDIGECSTADLQPDQVAAASRKIEPAQGTPTCVTSHRILLAEDNPDNRRLVIAYLRRAGLAVETAANGRIALEMVAQAIRQNQPYDLILMDMQMPELDGYEATRTLRRLGHRALPIIAFTAHALEEERAECRRAGCDDYASKPIEPDVLLATVWSHLNKRSAQQASTSSVDGTARATSATSTGAGDPIQSTRMDDPVLSAILPEYILNLPGQVAGLRSFVQSGELRELKSLIHQIKGSAGSYGFPQVTDLATQAETTVLLGKDIADVATEVTRLIDLIRRIEGYDPRRETCPA